MDKMKVTVLLIDDLVDKEGPLVVKLRQSFENVFVFDKPKNGLEYIEKNLNEKLIVILDIKFPESEFDGHSMLDKIRSISSLIPVILWSAVDEKDEIFSDFINNKAFAFLKQTTSANDIVNKVKEAYEYLNSNIASAIEEWIKKREKFESDKPYIITLSDGKQYTLQQILEEVRKQSSFGQQFSKDLNILTIDLLLRNKKKL